MDIHVDIDAERDVDIQMDIHIDRSIRMTLTLLSDLWIKLTPVGIDIHIIRHTCGYTHRFTSRSIRMSLASLSDVRINLTPVYQMYIWIYM